MTKTAKDKQKSSDYYQPVTVQATKYRGKYLNEKKAYERGLKPKEGAEGVMLWESSYKVKCEPYYSIEEELEAASEEEIFEFFEELRLERNRKSRERYHERILEEELAREEEERRREARLERQAYENSFKTSWQWLAQERRIPVEGAEAHLIEKPYYIGYDCWDSSSWYYYQEDDTRVVESWEYEKLKKLYISKFGGWETIDLENTEYDGRIWWDYRILVPELEGQDNFLDDSGEV